MPLRYFDRVPDDLLAVFAFYGLPADCHIAARLDRILALLREVRRLQLRPYAVGMGNKHIV